MDEKYLEIAEKITAAEIRSGIERAQKRAGPPPGFDGMCACGAEIDERRVNLGYYRCLNCQAQKERLGRQYRQ